MEESIADARAPAGREISEGRNEKSEVRSKRQKPEV